MIKSAGYQLMYYYAWEATICTSNGAHRNQALRAIWQVLNHFLKPFYSQVRGWRCSGDYRGVHSLLPLSLAQTRSVNTAICTLAVEEKMRANGDAGRRNAITGRKPALFCVDWAKKRRNPSGIEREIVVGPDPLRFYIECRQTFAAQRFTKNGVTHRSGNEASFPENFRNDFSRFCVGELECAHEAQKWVDQSISRDIMSWVLSWKFSIRFFNGRNMQFLLNFATLVSITAFNHCDHKIAWAQ